jgi:hypothetical protein
MSEPVYVASKPLPVEVPPASWNDQLPQGAQLSARLGRYSGRMSDLAGLKVWLGENGLDAVRLILSEGITIWEDPSGPRWIAVDYFVPGYPQEGKGLGSGILLNAEAGRTTDRAALAREPAVDRAVAELRVDVPGDLRHCFAWL